nr:hypothetical protein [Tanacetum cinerariifolium]
MSKDPYAYVVAAFQALPALEPGPEEPEQAPPSPVYMPYVPEPVYPEYILVEDEVFPAKEQPLPAAASPTTDSPGYIPESDPDKDPKDDDDEDPKEDPANYPADHDDDDEEEEPSGDDADEDPEDDNDEDLEEDLADYLADHDDDEEEDEPSEDDADKEDEEQDEDNNDEEEEHPALADSIPPPHALRVTAGESSAAAAARPIEGCRADYGFVGSAEAEIRRRIAEDIGYGIRDTWIDSRDVAEEEALTTLEGVNTRVTELAVVQAHDTQDIYGVIEDTQGRQTEIFQRVEALVNDSQYHYETGRLVEQEAIVSREAWAHSIGLSSAAHFELQGYMTHTWVQDQRIDAHDTLIVTLTTQLSSLQGHLVTAIGEIQALQAREQDRVGAPEGAGSST